MSVEVGFSVLHQPLPADPTDTPDWPKKVAAAQHWASVSLMAGSKLRTLSHEVDRQRALIQVLNRGLAPREAEIERLREENRHLKRNLQEARTMIYKVHSLIEDEVGCDLL